MKSLTAILLLSTAIVLPSLAEEAVTTFDAANALYAQGKYTTAAKAYESLVADGTTSATLYFNLGNAYFKAGQIGHAIASYRRAEQLAPRDPDVRGNLGFARNHVSAGNTPQKNLLQRALGKLTLNEWASLSAIAFWAWLILLSLRELKPALRTALTRHSLMTGLLTLALSGCTVADYAVNHFSKSAVVIRETQAKAGPLEDSQNTFTAKDGTELTVLDEREDWLQVSDPRNRLGWIKRSEVEVF